VFPLGKRATPQIVPSFLPVEVNGPT